MMNGGTGRLVTGSSGQVTVVRVRTPDRPGLLADLTALLAGLGLSCAKATISTEENGDVGMAVNEFWVPSFVRCD